MSHDSDKRIPDARVIEKEQEETVTLKEAPASEDNEAAEKSSCSVPANSSAQSSISVSRAESAQSHTMQPVRSAATDTVKPPKLYIGFLIALASTTLLTAWISSFRGTGYLEFGQYPHSFVLSYHFGSFAIFAPFLIYIGTCFSSLSQAFGKRFGKTKPLSFSMTTLLTFISVVAMPAYTILNIQSGGVGNYIRAEYPWLSLSDLALVFWMLIQMVCPIVFFRFLRKMEPSRSFLTPLIFPMLGAIDYALCLNFEKFLGQNYKDMFFAFWIITQISGIKYFWTQLASPKQHESTNPIQPSESMKAEKDTIIQYHPFAALSRWQKQQERALNKELKLVLCLAIPVMCFCFYMSYGFLKDAETRAAWDRVNANQAQTQLEANMREVRYRENLSQMMAELKSRDNKISNYVARFTLNSYGQIHSQVQLNARNSTDMSGEELEKRLKEESRFRQMIIDAQPLPSFDPVMTSGNLLPVVVDFGSPGENYSGVGVVIGRGAANLPGTTKALSAIAANQLASNVVISRIEQDANRAVPYYLGFGFLATLVGL
ncbi:MAG: hypothetical protein K2Z81_00515, partial [Cyanobacteria bacterium]|nr:hypothetical protein [Cyanobacteriota bacterium]